MKNMVRRLSLLVALFCSCFSYSNGLTSLAPKGAAATPAKKQKVAVLGGGGYLGALVFGFLQRASSLYGTGIGGYRCIGATSDTAVRMNRILSKNFCLAFASEETIKLTDLTSAEAIKSRLEGWDAVVFGSDMFLQTRSVSANTYEKTPNDKAWEVYWDKPNGAFSNDSTDVDIQQASKSILDNFLKGAAMAKVKHMVVVNDGSIVPELQQSGIPYTSIQHSKLVDMPDYTFQKGIQGDIAIEIADGSTEPKESVNREDVAALCIQALQSLDWSQSRSLVVSSKGPAVISAPQVPKRVDQQWCVNSHILEEKLVKAL